MKNIILDCDPGHDDAINIIIAAAKSDAFNILGITTVGGNVEVEKNTLNALKVLELLKSDIPVYKGQSRPLVRKIEIATEIHGESGMDGPVLPEPTRKEEKMHGVDFIIEAVKNSKDKVTLVPTGPLTNIAMALIKEPSIKENIEEIVLMGGGTFGNWTPAAEFNIFVDAEAAEVVFTSGIPLAVFGLDVTHQVIATDDIVQRVGKIDNEIATFVKELLIFFGQTYKDFFGINGGPIHDACTCMYLLNPNMFTMEDVNVTIETKGESTYGMTVVDLLKKTGKKENARFATGVDQDVFWNTFIDILTSFDS
ncbi:nucleoside hydrolase [Phocicoccus pinnipedialis]|uniref:Pyrimidine-specific ribonucleoside hydrolase RihA n=1 Tax=Phocicoccus pinnipedialis TaxID=110845 RepID=A0A6V7RCD6_9BACL|nr:nucleoside hydrolase [Jeotgalicoccus pinnipedialis]MBP1939882.1 inosine-uridine nucleoside N-ribohydrolase [Jeotgalicoccus pinnipedialis]CAD2074700.1 Pyrimidine-specific ribonucleoside hydrolase RihA [Jeotgalicoccus pinnipedialis]